MISNSVLFHQDIVPAHLSVVSMAPVVSGSPMGLDLVNMVGAELVGSHSSEWLPWQPLMNVLGHYSGETRHFL